MSSAFNIAIAIDFGTTFSGYAYCLTAHTATGDIYKNTEWTKQVNQKNAYIKTPTQLLYKDGKLEAWGYQAKRRYIELQQLGEAQNCCFFEKFKTLIFERQQVNAGGEPYLVVNGETFLLVDLIADFLREMRVLAIKDVNNHIGSDVDESRVRWCLTIPAIWDDAAKQLMEQAALKAGILKPGDFENGNFMFALEPEAASIYCLYVADKELGIVENQSTMLVVDCGGGTVDLTAHSIVRDSDEKGVREIVPGFGAADGHGGKDVDLNFIAYMTEVLGDVAIAKFRESYPDSFLDMLDDWENFKYGFDPESYVRGSFRIPAELRDILLQEYPEVIESLAKAQNNNTYNLWLSHEVMAEKIFGPVVANILNCIDTMFSRIEGQCDYMYLVGGFSTSRFLQNAIKQKFSEQVRKKILIPGEPGKSVMTGAASFARTPEMILPRKSRLSYGIASAISGVPADILLGAFLMEELTDDFQSHCKEILQKMQEDKDIANLLDKAQAKSQEMGFEAFTDSLREKLGYDEANDMLDINRQFSAFIEYGDTVVKDFQVPETFVLKSPANSEARIEIFAADKKNIMFVDEPGVEKVGEIVLKLPPLPDHKYRNIGVTMFFGDTRLKIQARCLASNSEVEAELNFLTMYRD